MPEPAPDVEGNRAWLIQRLRVLTPHIFAEEPTESTEQLRRLLALTEKQAAIYRDAGFVDERK